MIVTAAPPSPRPVRLALNSLLLALNLAFAASDASPRLLRQVAGSVCSGSADLRCCDWMVRCRIVILAAGQIMTKGVQLIGGARHDFLFLPALPFCFHSTETHNDHGRGPHRRKGPYRMLVDTGATSSVVDTKRSAELGLKALFKTELVNLISSRFVPGTRLHTLRIGALNLSELEVLIYEPKEARRRDPSIRGVLGMNALAQFNFLLSPREGKLEVGAKRPVGEGIPFDWNEGRMVVAGRMGEETLSLVIDSGASHVILFRTPVAMAKSHSRLSTLNTLDSNRQERPS